MYCMNKHRVVCAYVYVCERLSVRACVCVRMRAVIHLTTSSEMFLCAGPMRYGVRKGSAGLQLAKKP